MQAPDLTRTRSRSECQHSTGCVMHGECTQRQSCVMRLPVAQRLELLAQPAFPYPLRRDRSPRAVWPAGLTA
jgi:hypothetical protein